VAEALECHGGNGFITDHFMERLYREAPLNGIWEGTGNVICLDVLRAMQREPETVSVFLGEVRMVRGADSRLDAFTDAVERRLSKLNEFEPVARRVVEMMAFARAPAHNFQNRCSIGVQMRVRHHQLGFSSFPTPHTRGAKKWTAQPSASGSNTYPTPILGNRSKKSRRQRAKVR
jgi:hypothetical protein